MNSDNSPSQRATAEAAVWLARLQYGQRERGSDLAFRDWLDEDEAHQRSFESAAEIWELLPGAVDQGSTVTRSEYRPRSRYHAATRALACLFFCVVVGNLFLLMNRTDVYETGRGQQKTVSLADGSLVNLNTDSLIEVRYSSGERQVELRRGEALFHVAKDPARPFTVASGNGAVRALGTTFAVRSLNTQSAFTLVEGKVEVLTGSPKDNRRLALLIPGDRLILERSGRAVMDRPSIDALLSWRAGQVSFDDATLEDAAREMNRYLKMQQIVVSPRIAARRISGIFATGNPDQFVIAAVQVHDLKVRRQGEDILLMPASDRIAKIF